MWSLRGLSIRNLQWGGTLRPPRSVQIGVNPSKIQRLQRGSAGEILTIAPKSAATRCCCAKLGLEERFSQGSVNGIDIRTLDDGRRIIIVYPANVPMNKR